MLIQMTYLADALTVDTVRTSLVSSDVYVTPGTAVVREGNDDARG
jgi:hypothetical protein